MTLPSWPSGRRTIRPCSIPQGTFVDDVIVHRLGEDDFLLVINAGTREKDINWVRENTKGFDCHIEELSDAYTQLAIQGPRAAEVLQKLTDANLERDQKLLVHSWNCLRAERYSDRAHRLHRRRWL